MTDITDAEIEAGAIAIASRRFTRAAMLTWNELNEYEKQLYRGDARAVLTAARQANA